MSYSTNTSVTRARGYSGLQITLHWLIAALVAVQLIFGESMTASVDAMAEGGAASPFDQTIASLHYWFGTAILVLVVLRLFVRLTHGAPSSPDGIPGWMSFASRITHWIFYALLIAVPVTGLLGFYTDGPFGDIHAWAKPVFIGLIALHAGAALFHQFWLKDGLLKAMLVPAAKGEKQ
ncbi:cytochrome b [Rhizobium sp. PL01]|uniref:cytochrome b n=1 Tax=Rhizobium sp. PL01 TaxID=3085631 RepID=UPI002980DBF5|nr:cytochrome b/b6 domain-containing protein [Rhizobium sp. PL01]MDW5317574.1 cytochrome b/b6 domain-containing protein [Rhizobium sp. PL01]